jgi:hypothetical protein
MPLSTIYTEILLKVALNTKKPNQTIEYPDLNGPVNPDISGTICW